MNKIFKLGLMLAFSISTLNACSDVNITGVPNTSSNITSTTNPSVNNQQGQQPPMGDGPNRMQGNFGVLSELNLTTEQTTQLNAIRPQEMPNQDADSDKIKTALSEVFVSDNLTLETLKAKLTSLNLYDDTKLSAEADIILRSYNVLTYAQKQILSTKNEYMFNNSPSNKVINLGGNINTLATNLSLSAEQKTNLSTLIQPANNPMANNTDLQTEIGTELKNGKATNASILAILKGSSYISVFQDEELNKLVKIHDVLTSEQRTKFISTVNFGGMKGGGMGMPPEGAPPVIPS